MIEFWDWMRDRLEELDAGRTPEDDTDYLGLIPRALEWQRWLLIHALELLDRPGAIFRFRTVLLLVARQNGKSVLLTVLILWRMFQDRARMVMETHASLDHAKQAWLEAVAIAEAIPELADEIQKVNEGKGSELLWLDGGEMFKIASANRRGGRGFRGDLVIFDELREHQDWKAWSATSKTTMARARAQVWGVSNAGDSTSVVLRHLRTVALAGINGEAPEGIPDEILAEVDLDSIGLFEWSAAEERNGMPTSKWDREGWAEANPSMGYSELDERAIAAAAFSDPDWEFRTEVLCQFVNMAGQGPFPNGSWQKTSVPRVQRDTARPAAYCVDLSHNRQMAYIALAFWDTEGRRRVEIVAKRAGTEWIIPWLLSPARKVKPEHVTLQTNGAPISSMVAEFEQAGIELAPWSGADLARWSGVFYDGIRRSMDDEADGGELTLTHGIQPVLDLAATSARIKALGDGWAIDRDKSPEDAAPLVAAIGAIGLLNTNPEPTVSVYETRGLVFLD
ncbi:terminase large subunit domain-containing protein [Herbiconiux solani]|uniref:terminase large subunit domain-containing protein n=1 Tax=Herbiconiux solani TaxID=661329 RepID=UPI000825975F|nr:terminase family protein [Herbiconiux solani]